MNKLHLLPTSVSKRDCYKTKLLPPLSNGKSDYLRQDFAEGINPPFSNMETYTHDLLFLTPNSKFQVRLLTNCEE